MKTEYHAFVDGDVGRCGAILRRMEPRSLRTRTVFRMGEDAPLYLVDHVVDHEGDVRRWRQFTYDSPTSESQHSGTRDADGAVHVDGTPAPALLDAIGAYGEHLVLTQMLSDEADTASYLQFDESEPEQDPQAAELHRTGIEATELMESPPWTRSVSSSFWPDTPPTRTGSSTESWRSPTGVGAVVPGRRPRTLCQGWTRRWQPDQKKFASQAVGRASD